MKRTGPPSVEGCCVQPGAATTRSSLNSSGISTVTAVRAVSKWESTGSDTVTDLPGSAEIGVNRGCAPAGSATATTRHMASARMAEMRRIAATVAIVLVAIVAMATPASAHATGGETTSNYLTTVTKQPALDGVTADVLQSGDRLEIRNDGPEITVIGYNDEPYLRIGPEGVFENENSPGHLHQPGPQGPDSAAVGRYDTAPLRSGERSATATRPLPRPPRTLDVGDAATAGADDKGQASRDLRRGGIGPEWAVTCTEETGGPPHRSPRMGARSLARCRGSPWPSLSAVALAAVGLLPVDPASDDRRRRSGLGDRRR